VHPVVGRQRQAVQLVSDAEGDPFVAAAAQGSRRAGLIGDPAVTAAKHQDLDELIEDDALGNALAVAAKGMVDLAGGHSVANWSQRGSRMQAGIAGTRPPRDHLVGELGDHHGSYLSCSTSPYWRKPLFV
jgi:hypothetical protein